MPAARSTSNARRNLKAQGPPREPRLEAGDEIASPAPLVTWTEVFPLSPGPAHRVRLHTGPRSGADLVEAITADYVRELSERVPDGCRISADGDLFGPCEVEGTAADVLFAAAFATDLDAVVRRHSPPGPTRSDPRNRRPSPPSRSTTG